MCRSSEQRRRHQTALDLPRRPCRGPSIRPCDGAAGEPANPGGAICRRFGGYQVKSAEGTMLPGVVLQGAVSRKHGNAVKGLMTRRRASRSARSSDLSGRCGIRPDSPGQGNSGAAADPRRLRAGLGAADSRIGACAARIGTLPESRPAGRRSPQRNLALEGVIEERKVGQRTTLDVLDAQQDVLDGRSRWRARNAMGGCKLCLARRNGPPDSQEPGPAGGRISGRGTLRRPSRTNGSACGTVDGR